MSGGCAPGSRSPCRGTPWPSPCAQGAGGDGFPVLISTRFLSGSCRVRGKQLGGTAGAEPLLSLPCAHSRSRCPRRPTRPHTRLRRLIRLRVQSCQRQARPWWLTALGLSGIFQSSSGSLRSCQALTTASAQEPRPHLMGQRMTSAKPAAANRPHGHHGSWRPGTMSPPPDPSSPRAPPPALTDLLPPLEPWRERALSWESRGTETCPPVRLGLCACTTAACGAVVLPSSSLKG